MQKKLLTIILTALLFFSAVALGSATVFRVDEVAVVATVVSEEATTDVAELQNELLAIYKGEGIFSVKRRDMSEIMEEYSYLRVVEFRKAYPNKIIVTVEEEAEVYAVEKEDGGYYILGAAGAILALRDTSKNRLDDMDNIVIKGVSLSGEKGGVLSGDDCWDNVLSLCQEMDKMLGGIRSNVLSVEVLTRSPETLYKFTMTEGVKIYVGNPTVMTEEKVKKAINEYMALSNEQRMTGRITVRDAEGQVFVAYASMDEFE